MVGKDKRYVNRIIQAHGVIEDLMLEGVKESELPNSERICRELAHYPMPDMKKIWQGPSNSRWPPARATLIR